MLKRKFASLCYSGVFRSLNCAGGILRKFAAGRRRRHFTDGSRYNESGQRH